LTASSDESEKIMPAEKTEALKNFEREWNEAVTSLLQGEREEYQAKMKDLMKRWGPGMTERELESVMRTLLLEVYEAAKRSSKLGHPIAESILERPN
jgi:hypothetical protein